MSAARLGGACFDWSAGRGYNPGEVASDRISGAKYAARPAAPILGPAMACASGEVSGIWKKSRESAF
jgi:hypothetical protein